jgi:DNA-directed RNA polymerase II subunit RPB11
MDYNEEQTAVDVDMDVPTVTNVREVPTVRLRRPSSPGMHSQHVSAPSGLQGEQGHLHMPQHQWRTQNGYFWTAKVRPDFDIPDRHELFLLADGERKIEMETITRKSNAPPKNQLQRRLANTFLTEVANAALFTFNKEDHTLANMLRDKLFRMDHVTFAAYKVPHPLFATFQLRIHTDGEIAPKAAVIKACQELINQLQELDQEFTKEFELKKMAANVPNGGLDI